MGRRTELRAELDAVPLFAACSKRELGIVARHLQVVSVPAGMDIVTEGERGDAFYVVLDGKASVRRGEREVSVLGPGGWFGELALLDPAPRNATVRAEEETSLGVLGAAVFRAMLRDVPDLTEKLLKGVARRLREADALAS